MQKFLPIMLTITRHEISLTSISLTSLKVRAFPTFKKSNLTNLMIQETQDLLNSINRIRLI